MTKSNIDSLENIQSGIRNAQTLSFVERALGQNNVDILRHLFPRQTGFSLTAVKIIDATEDHLDFTASFSSLQPWGQPVSATFTLLDHESERHLVFQFNIPANSNAYLFLSQYSLAPDEPLPDSLESAPFLDLAGWAQQIDFSPGADQQVLLFSTFDYVANGSSGVYYPESFKKTFPAEQVQAGLNFPVNLSLDDDTSNYFAEMFGGAHSGVIECSGLVFEQGDIPWFKFNKPMESSKTIASFSLALTGIDLAVPLARGVDARPVIGLMGKIQIDNQDFDIYADFDLYYRTLFLTFRNFPSLGSLIDLRDNFPGPLSSLLEVELSMLQMVLGLEEGVIYEIDFGLTTDKPLTLFSLTPSCDITIQPSLHLQIRAPFDTQKREIEGALKGDWQLGTTSFKTQLYFPDYTFTAYMADGETVDLEVIFKQLLPGGEVPQLEITKMALFGDFLEKSASAEITVDGGSTWKFSLANRDFKLKQISLGTYYANGNLEHCGLEGQFEMVGAGLYAGAKYDLNQGLMVTAGTASGAQIDVDKLADNLLAGLSLPGDFPSLQLTDIFFSATPKNGEYSLSGRTSSAPWGLKPNLSLQVERFAIDKTQNSPLGGTLDVTMSIAGIGVWLTADKDTSQDGGWQFEGSTSPDQKIPLGKLIEDLAQKFGDITPPTAVADLNIESLHITFNSQSKDFIFTCKSQFPVNHKKVDLILIIDTKHQGDTYSQEFKGKMTLAGLEFDVEFESKDGTEALLATFQQKQSALNLKGLVSDVTNDPDLLSLVPPLTLSIKDVLLAITDDQSGSEPGTAEPADATSRTPKRTVVFGLALDASLSLLDLPLLGELPGSGLSGGIDNLQVFYANQDVAGEQVNSLNSLLPDGAGPLPSTPKGDTTGLALNKGFNFAADLNLDKLPFTLSTAGSQPAVDGLDDPGPAPGTFKPASVLSGSPATSSSVKWINIQKGIGPIYLQKIGVRYDKGEIWFLLNADLTIAGLTISLNGLGISSALQAFAPTFHLQGLGIDYRELELEIGGTFLHFQGQDAQGQPFDEYNGLLQVNAEDWSLMAIGSYASVEGHPSLFAYLAIDYPLGGPSFFFVTGLAAGFGYNRRLIPPSAENVAQFPLVAQAMGNLPTPPLPSGSAAIRKTLIDQMANLSQYIPPTPGEYFLAVGIRFTSFKILHGFVLVTAEFGQRFLLNMIGLLSYETPPELGPGVPPLIHVELGITATYDPQEGFLGMRAVLANNSYLYDPACHLTGGMAFYSWFSGEHAGEFALTVGGYHPNFKVPEYYPQVPRLNINWQRTPELSIQGSAYFALTGHAFMAGGALAAVWQSGSYRAWFTAAIDFLIQWKPYHYEASLHLEIGGSATLHAFGTHTISASVGADLEIWGPEFAGRASVDFTLFSVDISFGPEKKAPAPISFTEFHQTFLPAGEDHILTLTTREGLVKELRGLRMDDQGQLIESGDQNDRLWLLNARHFHLAAESVIPVNTWRFGDQSGEQVKNFGIAPMDLRPEFFVSLLEITLEHFEDGKSQNITREFLPVETDKLLITKPMPVGMWGASFQPALNGPTMVDDLLTGFHILPGAEPAPGITHAVDRKNLSFEMVSHDECLLEPAFWETKSLLAPDPQSDERVVPALATSLLNHFMPQEQIHLEGRLSPDELLVSRDEKTA